MFDFSTLLASLTTGIQDALVGAILQFVTTLINGFFGLA